MSSSNTGNPKRTDKPGWSVAASGDNDVELLLFEVDVADFNESARIGAEIAGWIEDKGRDDPTYFTQITLRGWRVGFTIAAPVGEWYSFAQKELAELIWERFHS